MKKMSFYNNLKMSEVQMLRLALKKRLAEAHEAAGHPTGERSSLQHDDVRKQSEIKSDHQNWSPTLDQEDLHIKDEQEERDITDLTVIVKSEDEEEKFQPVEFHHTQSKENSNSVRRSDPDADQCSGPDTEEETSDSSDYTEDDISESSDNIEDYTPDSSDTDISDRNWEESIDHKSDIKSVNSGINKLYKCTKCSITFNSKANLLGHKKIHKKFHSEDRLFSCSVCKATFTMKYLLVEHTRIHTREKPFSCSICGQSFVKGENWTRHMRFHAMEAPFRNVLMQHMKTHGAEEPFHCAECGESCSGDSYLARHMACRTDGGLFICSVCKAPFEWKKPLLKNTNTCEDIKPYICSLCNVAFKNNYDLIQHSRTHAGDKVCKNVFAKKDKHMSPTEEKLFSCSICKNIYQKRVSLLNHMRRHTGKKPSDICHKNDSQGSGVKTKQQLYGATTSKATGLKRKSLN